MSAGTVPQRITSWLSGQTPDMPRPRTSRHLPRSVSIPAVVMRGKPLPADVQRCFDAAYKAVLAEERKYVPVATLNRVFAAIKRRHPQTFAVVEAWLRLPDTTELFTRSGLMWAHEYWVTAIVRLQGGATASKAFGIRPGPAVSWEFSVAERRAFRVEMECRRLQRQAKLPPSKIQHVGRSAFTEAALRRVLQETAGSNDDRAIRRALAEVRSIGIDDATMKRLSDC